MIDTEKWQEIYTSLSKHKLRTALTAFGVFWGIFMLTVLLGAGNGLKNGVTDGFKEVPNAVWIWPQAKTQLPYQGLRTGRQIHLRPADVSAVRNHVTTAKYVYGQNSVGIWGGSPIYTVYKGESGSYSIQGTHPGLEKLHRQTVIAGRYINQLDDEKRRKVAIIGTKVKEQLFPNTNNNDVIGTFITLADISFQVIGIYTTNAHNPNSNDDEKIYIPNDTLRYAFNQVSWVGSIVVIPQPGIHASLTENDAKEFLMEKNRVAPEDTSVFGSFNLQTEFDKVNGLFTGINIFSWVVAIGTIMAGAIGVGNIMLIVVKERTREIGLRKALGATPAAIVSMVVQESIVLTAVSGYFGLVAGVFLLEGITKVLEISGGNTGMFRNPEVDFNTAIISVLILIVSGFFAALLPATKAASVNPITALQDE